VPIRRNRLAAPLDAVISTSRMFPENQAEQAFEHGFNPTQDAS
jgi:hypothetical protein